MPKSVSMEQLLLSILLITILVNSNVLRLIHAVSSTEVTAIRIVTLSKVAFKGTLMAEICFSSAHARPSHSGGANTHSNQDFRSTDSYKGGSSSYIAEH